MVDIQALVMIGGHLPPRALGMVIEWAMQHQGELIDLWERAANKQALYRVPPLE